MLGPILLGFDWNGARRAAKVAVVHGRDHLKPFGNAIHMYVPSVAAKAGLAPGAADIFPQAGRDVSNLSRDSA
jgi:hypothetical protein